MKASDSAATRGTMLDRIRVTGLADELLDEVEVRVRRHRRRRLVVRQTAAATALLLIVAIWAVPYFRDTSTVSAAVAQRQSLALPDGSRAELNAQTSLHLDFRYGRRVVRLDHGEAFFSVAKDTAHPFYVETAVGTIRVTGTQFDVNLGDDHQANVTLLEGLVNVQNAGAGPVKLVSGQQLAFGPAGEVLRNLTPVEIEGVTAWRNGRLILDGLTLGQAVAKFARFHDLKMEIDPEIAGLHPGGTVPLANVSQFLDALRATNRVIVMPASDGSYRLIARPRE